MKSLFVVLFVACAISVTIAGDFSALFVSDCQGSIQFAPSHGLINTYLGLGKLASGASALFTAYRERLQCACPSLSDSEFERLFLPGPALLLNLMRGPAADKSWPTSCGNLTALTGIINAANIQNFPTFVLPDTCSYETWEQTGKCNIQSHFNAIDASIRLTIEKCPNSVLVPYVAITCSGAGCSQVAKPCQGDNDCSSAAGFVCNTVKINDNGTMVNWPGDFNIFNAIKTMLLYDDVDTPNGCKAPSSVFGSLMDFVRGYFDGGAIAATSTMKFCGPVIDFSNSSAVGEMFEVAERCNITRKETCSGSPPTSEGPKREVGPVESGNCQSTLEKIDCTTKGLLEEFDGVGVVPSSKVSPHPIPISGVTPLTSGAKVILSVDCSGLVSLLPTSVIGGAGQFFALESAAKFMYDEIKQIQTCRRGGSPVLTEEAFKIRYMGIAEKALYYLTTPVTALSNPGPEMSDWSFGNTQKKVALPSTCNFAHWQQNGYCAVKYIGLQSLLGLDITLQARVKACPAGNPIPQVYVECVGAACYGIQKPLPCNLGSECNGGLLCRDLNVDIFERFNVTAEADFLAQMAFGKNNLYPTCRGLNKLKIDIRNLLMEMAGKPQDNSLVNKMCFVDMDHVESQLEGGAWVEGQFTTSGSTITLSDLISWTNTPTTDPLPTPAGGATPIDPNLIGDSASTIIFSAVTLIAGLVATFFF